MIKEEIINFIKKIVEQHKLTYGSILFSKKNKEISDFIIKYTEFLDIIPNIKNFTRIYCIVHGITEIPKCKVCGKQILRNIKPIVGFAKYCSAKCENADPDVIQKLKKTNIEKYGRAWSFQSENNQIKSRKTMIEKYGVEYAQQNQEIHDKANATRMLKYGAACPMECTEIKNKAVQNARKNQFRKIQSCSNIIPLFSSDEYSRFGMSHVYKWKCARCGKEFESSIDKSWFKQGQDKQYARCEKCFPRKAGTSAAQTELEDFIKSICAYPVLTRKRCLENNSGIKKQKLEIDIFIPELKLGFEYDGLYFHSKKFGKGKNYHLLKTEAAEKEGLTLIHVFESDWQCRKEITKSRIRNLIGIYEKTIFARKCEIRITTSNEATEFLEKNHLQGPVNSQISLGLYFKNELLSLMTFGKCRFDKKHEWEMLRFCNKLNYHIPGAAGKLLKYFEKTYKPKSLVSYADRRWSRGKLYEALGFSLIRKSNPNYWYFKNGFRLMSRMNFQKHMLRSILPNFDEKKTEIQNMMDSGYNCIYDAGNLVFEKTYD